MQKEAQRVSYNADGILESRGEKINESEPGGEKNRWDK